jgi:hypothetical protein
VVTDSDTEGHLLGRVIELVGQKCLEYLAAALLLTFAPGRLTLSTASLI